MVRKSGRPGKEDDGDQLHPREEIIWGRSTHLIATVTASPACPMLSSCKTGAVVANCGSSLWSAHGIRCPRRRAWLNTPPCNFAGRLTLNFIYGFTRALSLFRFVSLLFPRSPD